MILIGFKNSGKTQVGRLLAERTHRVFIDVDDVVVHMHGAATSIADVYRQLGETQFRALEKRAVASLVDVQNAVIATGGGVVLDDENCSILRSLGEVIYLQVPKMVIKQRTLRDPVPAFIDAKNPEQSFEALYQQRKPLYEMMADRTVDTTHRTVDNIVEEIVNGQ